MKHKKKIAVIIICSIIGLLVFAGLAYLIVRPAAIVGCGAVTNKAWQSKISQYQQAKNFYLDENNVNMASLDLPSDDIIKEQALEDLIKSKIISQLAKKHGVSASQDDIDSAYREIVLSQVKNGEDSAEKTLEQVYGMSLEQFKQEVVKEYVLREKLAEKLSDQIKPLARKKAQEVFDKANASPKQFEDLARMYSEDSLALTGGDMGYIGRGEMITSYENTVWPLKPGEISDLIETPAGYYIVKVENKKTIDGEEQIKIRQIFIKNDLDKLIDESLSSYSIIRLVK